MLFIDGQHVPVENRIGEAGRGFSCVLHGMNPALPGRRGRLCLVQGAVVCAKECIVFDGPISPTRELVLRHVEQ